MGAPCQFSHVILNTRRLEELRDFYVALLDARVMYEDGRAAFITHDDEHHRMGFLRIPGDPEPVGEPESMTAEIEGRKVTVTMVLEPPLSHFSFRFDTLLNLLENWERLSGLGIRPAASINHVTSISLYYHDPDGNQVELLSDNMHSWDEVEAFYEEVRAKGYMPGWEIDPDVMLHQLRDGAPAADLIATP